MIVFINSIRKVVHDTHTRTALRCVTHLTFSTIFNKPIMNVIPNSIIHLTFGEYFNTSIENAIPNSVTHLIFGNLFNQLITNTMPNSIVYLIFGMFFNQVLDSIPVCIKEIIMPKSYDWKILELIPANKLAKKELIECSNLCKMILE